VSVEEKKGWQKNQGCKQRLPISFFVGSLKTCGSVK
jgi:hypothetical protein